MKASAVVALALAVAAAVTVVQAHVCLLNPAQRGGPHTITAAADPWCRLLTGPCGGAAPELPQTEYRRNDTLTVAWQKNQDHWNATLPGYFSVSFATAPDAPFTELVRVPDSATPSLTIYEAAVVLHTPSPTAVLAVQYNSGQGFSFFACSDIVIN